MFKTKTVDGVLAVFAKAKADLEALLVTQKTQLDDLEIKQKELNDQKDEVLEERGKAYKALSQLNTMLGN